MTDNRTTEKLMREFVDAACECEVRDYLISEYAERIEQAIAASLGSGTLTAEQVREAIEEAKDELLESCEYVGDMYQRQSDVLKAFGKMEQAIADELNAELGSGTCEFVVKDNMNESEGMGDVWIECSACHCQFDYYADDWLMKMSYCPNCGARIRKAATR